MHNFYGQIQKKKINNKIKKAKFIKNVSNLYSENKKKYMVANSFNLKLESKYSSHYSKIFSKKKNKVQKTNSKKVKKNNYLDNSNKSTNKSPSLIFKLNTYKKNNTSKNNNNSFKLKNYNKKNFSYYYKSEKKFFINRENLYVKIQNQNYNNYYLENKFRKFELIQPFIMSEIKFYFYPKILPFNFSVINLRKCKNIKIKTQFKNNFNKFFKKIKFSTYNYYKMDKFSIKNSLVYLKKVNKNEEVLLNYNSYWGKVINRLLSYSNVLKHEIGYYKYLNKNVNINELDWDNKIKYDIEKNYSILFN